MAFSQNVGIGTSTPDASAQLDISHVSKGLLIPRMNTAAIASISNPAKDCWYMNLQKPADGKHGHTYHT
jgi:hypothetical protein